MTANESVDRRVQRSRALLRAALEHLAEHRDIADITIRDITDQANLGRATFYLHYRSKDELVAELIDELVEEMRISMTTASEAYADAVAANAAVKRQRFGTNMLDLLDQRKTLYRSLARSSAGLEFATRMEKLYEDRFLYILQSTGKVPAPDSPSFEYRARYAAGGARAVTWGWLEQPDAPRAEIGSYWTRYITLFLITQNVVDPEELEEGKENAPT